MNVYLLHSSFLSPELSNLYSKVKSKSVGP